MNILILQGPNLNLLGLKSSESNKSLTLDKLNKAIRKHVHQKDVTLKFLQTHKQFQAINFLQRNRSWADGLMIIPTSWAKYDWSIAESIQLINLPTAVIYFAPSFSFGTQKSDSIINGENVQSFSGLPIETCFSGLDHLIN